ncbi:MAG: HAD family hydrolase [Empedobacter falsenii]
MIVTFDFDGTLTNPKVKEYFLELIDRGIDVWVVTSRYDDLHRHRYPRNPTNEDLWSIIDSLNFPRYKVRFMNMESKANYLYHTSAIWHLDDDRVELEDISKQTTTKAINVENYDWRTYCEEMLLTPTP